MSVSSTPRKVTLKASGAITKYTFVKFGATKDLVAQCGANERSIGICQATADAADGEFVEVALPGGGALLQVGETVALGKILTSTSAGLGEVADAAGEWCGALAYESGVVSDIIGVEVIATQAQASDA
ncbi:DUF2190 family protein [Candidatus Pacearchaeota archaeon]|nr:DUF2190 family protein [Candidatus Pacearchaeota archaeon]